VAESISWLLPSLRCPDCAAQLAMAGDGLVCRSRHEFPVIDGVPVLLPSSDAPGVAEQHASQREFYDQVFSAGGAYSLALWQDAYVRRLKPLWEANAGAPFLDVGAGGDAYTVIEAARSGMLGVGCDLSLEAMRRAHRLSVGEGFAGRCAFVVCLAERLPFAEATFGTASAVHVLEHLVDDRGAAGELARVCKPGAKVFIGVPNTFDKMPALLRPIYRWHDRRIGHLRQYSGDSLQALARDAGLEPVRLTFSAHWVKVWQLAIHVVAGKLHIKDDALWWWLEERDRGAGSRDNGLHLNLLTERRGLASGPTEMPFHG
jgi:ubiquinone/menaquinone biosynthesis C-methylase UbiE